jgi:hypothetical protein
MHARAEISQTAASWPEEIFAILQRFDVRQVPYLPDAGHSLLIERVLASSSMRGIATAASADLAGVAKACGIKDSCAMTTMAEIEALALRLQDVTSGPRFASVKIDGANLERVLSSRDGTFIINRIRGSLGHQPI